MNPFLEVGSLVRHAERPEWGLGQIQSVVGDRVTVNFEHAGKVVIEAETAPLVVETPDWL